VSAAGFAVERLPLNVVLARPDEGEKNSEELTEVENNPLKKEKLTKLELVRALPGT